MPTQLLLVLSLIAAGPSAPQSGSIGGVVVNASQGDTPVSGAEVALRVKVDKQFVLAAETTTDEDGRFLFDNLPADPEYSYLPGANWQTVHYPGRRIQLSDRQRDLRVRIEVRDSIQTPNPLRVRDHRIEIQRQSNALRVTESLTVENPEETTYVGLPKGKSGRAATLSLSVPADFVRTTFQKEFYGRRFVLIDKKLVTDIPWTPGIRELEFTYVLPAEGPKWTWERPLDLPTSRVLLTVRSPDLEQAQDLEPLSCNMQPMHTDDDGAAAFVAEALPAGHVLRVELGQVPAPLMSYARWAALFIVTGLIALTGLYLRRQRKRPAERVPVPNFLRQDSRATRATYEKP